MKHVIGKKTVGWTEKDPGDREKREYDGMEDLYEMIFKRKSFHYNNMKYIVELHKDEGTDVEKTKVATYKMQG